MENYKRALDTVMAEIQATLRQRQILDDRLAQLKETAEKLSLLLKNPPQLEPGFWSRIIDTIPENMGITDAIRHILLEVAVPLTPTEIRDVLKDQEVDSDYDNAMAVIHNTLRRLEKQGEVKETPNGWVLTDKAIKTIESLKLKKKS